MLIGALLLYHAADAIHPAVTLPDHAELDFSAAWLRGWGYRLAYESRRVPDFFFLGPRRPWQRAYVREEIPFQFTSSLSAVETGLAAPVRRLVAALAPKGVTVIALPVPTKISLERELLPARLPDAQWWDWDPIYSLRSGSEAPESVYRAVTAAAPSETVDLFRVFSAYRASHPDAELFLPADSHWTALGITLAAAAVLDNLRARGWAIPRLTPRAAGEMPWTYAYDFLTALQLPLAYVARAPQFDWREPLYRLPVTVAPEAGRLWIAGSSYSRRLQGTGFSLGEQVAGALHRRLILIEHDGGRAAWGLNQMRAAGQKLRRGDVLIWEFALRQPLAPSDSWDPPEVEDGVR